MKNHKVKIEKIKIKSEIKTEPEMQINEIEEKVENKMSTSEIEGKKVESEMKEESKTKKKDRKKMDPAKKKKIRRFVILGVIVAIILFFFIYSRIAASAPRQIMTTAAIKGEIEQTIETSGTVETNQTKTYFSDVNVKIGNVKVKVGDAVKKGDLLLAYDEDALKRETQLAQLDLQSGEGSYKNSVQNNNETLSDLKEANVNLEVLDQQIEDTEKYITNLENKIAKKKSDLAHFGALLQISLLDWQDQPDSEEYMNLQKQVQLNNYEQGNNEEVKGWEDELKVYNDMLSDYKEYRAEMKSQKSASESGRMTGGAKEELEANNETKKIQSEEKLEELVQVENGIQAEFDGVITAVSAVEGATLQPGGELFTLESTEDVLARITITKYDLDKVTVGQKAMVTIAGKTYDGEVTKINKMAEKNQGGAAVVGCEIQIMNPDSDIFLGVEAKVVVYTAKKSDAIQIPAQAVNTDMEGNFVYIVANGMIEKRRVVVGISSDTMTEILEGINEGDQIITEVTSDIIEGEAAVAIPQA